MKKRKNKKPTYFALIITCIIAAVLLLTIGWSAFNSTMNVSSYVYVRIPADIRVTDFAVYQVANNGSSTYENYNVDSVTGDINLPSANSTVTYRVEVSNLQLSNGVTMGILEMSGLPQELDILSITDYTLKDKICDDTVPANCGTGAQKTFYIEIGYNNSSYYDSSDTTYSFDVNFDFREFHSISYSNITGNYPTEILDGDELQITLADVTAERLEVAGTSTYTLGTDYTFTNHILVIPDVSEDLIITCQVGRSYFMEFSGENDLFGFNKSTIKTFSRDTTSTAQQVAAINNKVLISNTVSGAYESYYDVWGWVDANNNFKWWSEADIVYFHPDTTRAFRNFAALTSVNLTGTSTELIKNFAHFFDNSQKLETITGAIKTDGLDSVNNNYAYNNDTEGDSSNVGFAYMFNDCKKLTSVDISQMDTSNATDMKRMFAGCAVLGNIDVSHFDTSNVRSMYWMFRNCQAMTTIDVRSFDTGNVENMWGMFYNAKLVTTVHLGSGFDTQKVKKMNYMFGNMYALETIYAVSNFDLRASPSSSNMFTNDSNLVGEYGGTYETPFTSSKNNASYARIPDANGGGYFTQDYGSTRYSITYNLNGGTATNPRYYYYESNQIILNNPTKSGYTFSGWTGTGLSQPTMHVIIPSGSTGNRTYTANFVANGYTIYFNANGGTGSMSEQVFSVGVAQDLTTNAYTRTGYRFVGWNTADDRSGDSFWNNESILDLIPSGSITLYAQWVPENSDDSFFTTEFLVEGSCTFNGYSGNITGSTCINTAHNGSVTYYNTDYIDTLLDLYTNANIDKDFLISFNISGYTPGNQSAGETQHTIVNCKYENSTQKYPGFAFRRNDTKLELTNSLNGTKVAIQNEYNTVSSLTIIRKNSILYYKINNGDRTFWQDISTNRQTFATTLTFGASLNSSGTAWRKTKVTLSNIIVKVGKFGD